jgi:hypothetical protein
MGTLDALSYVFLGCFVFSATFLVITTVLGLGHGHTLGAGGHTAHLHVPHLAGHHIGGHAAGGHVAGHAAGGHAASGHATAHANGAHTANTTNAANSANGTGSAADAGGFAPLDSLKALFLGSLNLYGLLVLLLIFGLLGFLLHNVANVGPELSFIFALVVGAGCAMFVSALLSRLFFERMVGALGAESSQLEGRLGKVSMGVRPGGIGEVIFTNTQGGRQSMGARSADGEAIPVDTEVVILGSEKGIATVQPWDRFMADVRAGTAAQLQPIDLG